MNKLEKLVQFNGYKEWKSWKDERFGFFTPEECHYFRKEFSACGVYSHTGLKILEIGFGEGNFAGWAKSQGFDYSGLEVIDSLVNQGRLLGFRVENSKNNLADFINEKSIDVVIAFDVFEHLSVAQLSERLEDIYHWLKPNGLLIFRVPSGDSPFSRHLQHGDLTHKIILGSSAIKQLANFYGYEVLKIKEPAFPILGLGIIRFFRRGFVCIAQKIITKITQAIFHGNTNTIITSNMIAVLKKIEGRLK